MCDPKQGQPESLLGVLMHIMQLGSQARMTPAQSSWLPPCLASSRKLISAGGERMSGWKDKQRTRESPIEKPQAALRLKSNIWGTSFWMSSLKFYKLPPSQDPSHLRYELFSMGKMLSELPASGKHKLANQPTIFPSFPRLSPSLIHWIPFLPRYLSLVFFWWATILLTVWFKLPLT